MTSNAEVDTATAATGQDQVPVLLVEDDDGDALLVTELLREAGAAVVVQRARSVGQAKTLVSGAADRQLLPDPRMPAHLTRS